MSNCIFCNKFSSLLNSEDICNDCYQKYTIEMEKVVYYVNYLLNMTDSNHNSLEFRKYKLDELKKLYYDFTKTPAGKILEMYHSTTFSQIQTEINTRELEFDRLLRKKEICRYSKIEGAPNDYVIFDLETTGFDSEKDAILEIGAIKYINNTETDRFHTYVNPERSIPKKASKVNNITVDKVKEAPTIKSVLPDFLAFIGNLTLIAYNSDFDMGFMQMKCNCNLDKKITNDVIDTLPLARKYLPQLPNKKLETVKQHFNLDVGSHNAIDDCIVTNHLYQYCKQFEELKYKYVIPFPYDPHELSNLEVEYINTAVEICEKNGTSKKGMILKSGSLLSIVDKDYNTIVSFKLYGKLQYVLLNVPFDKFENECQTEIKHTASTKSEGNYTRVFTENPQQLWEFQKYIK